MRYYTTEKKPQVRPEHLKYFSALSAKKQADLASELAVTLLTMIDISAEMEKAYFTVGTRMDKTAFILSMNIDGNKEPVYFANAAELVLRFGNMVDQVFSQENETQEEEKEEENPF